MGDGLDRQPRGGATRHVPHQDENRNQFRLDSFVPILQELPIIPRDEHNYTHVRIQNCLCKKTKHKTCGKTKVYGMRNEQHWGPDATRDLS